MEKPIDIRIAELEAELAQLKIKQSWEDKPRLVHNGKLQHFLYEDEIIDSNITSEIFSEYNHIYVAEDSIYKPVLEKHDGDWVFYLKLKEEL